MRYSINWKNQEVKLRKELDMIFGYINLVNLISDTPVTLETMIEKEMEEYIIPKMSIQPLIENCVNHGFEPKGRNGLIRLTACREGDTFIVNVFDDGIGMTKEEAANVEAALAGIEALPENHSRTGIGLDNVNERLKLRYGSDKGLKIESVYGEYTMVRLHFRFHGGDL